MSASSRHGDHHHLSAVNEGEEDASSESDSESTSTVPQNKRDELINPYWIEDPDVGKGEVEYLSSNEMQFWKDLLAKYLFPLDENKEEKVTFWIQFASKAHNNCVFKVGRYYSII